MTFFYKFLLVFDKIVSILSRNSHMHIQLLTLPNVVRIPQNYSVLTRCFGSVDVLIQYPLTFLTVFCHLSFSYITATDHESVRKAVIKVKEVSQRLSKEHTGLVAVVLSSL
jgi:hypothetical protein